MIYHEPIFLKPAFQERIWGGNRLKDIYDYDIPSDKTGEAWVVSAHPNGPSIIANGPLVNQSLLSAWQQYPSLFGKESSAVAFPLLVKIIDANDRLSVQVHPNDSYARKIENEPYGKTECWYILACDEDSEIIFGHRATSKQEFKDMIKANRWDDLLIRVKVKKGDFFYVPSGTIHAIGKGVVILEIQQSSDITYRLYDYDRRDTTGKLRELHLDAALEVATYPHQEHAFEKQIEVKEDLQSTCLIKGPYFTVFHWQLTGHVSTPLIADYLLLNVIEGSGKMIVNNQEYKIEKGDHLILPSSIDSYDLTGDLEIMVSHE